VTKYILLGACFMLCSSTLKMEAEMQVAFHQTTWRHIPEDRTIVTIAVRITP
jgi:hypothetical protein